MNLYYTENKNGIIIVRMWGKYEDLFSQKNRNIPRGTSLTTMQLIIFLLNDM